jgi:hypothetical protein
VTVHPVPAGLRPRYAQVLRLRFLSPSGALCFLYFEGSIVLGVLLVLAELARWPVLVALPATIATMVKVNDLVAGVLAGRGG